MRANIVTMGSPVVGSSWAELFSESGVGTFNSIVGVIQSGGPFDSITESFSVYGSLPPGLSAEGWSSTLSADYKTATISGAPTTDLNFYGTFAGAVSNPLSLTFYTYDGSQLVDETLMNWSGSSGPGWTSTTVPVTEPTTVIAGALLLLPFGASMFRILRKMPSL
ncbi:MAG: hypothetical protein WBW41_04980 [Verrucomicrobiia bacterium]